MASDIYFTVSPLTSTSVRVHIDNQNHWASQLVIYLYIPPANWTDNIEYWEYLGAYGPVYVGSQTNTAYIDITGLTGGKTYVGLPYFAGNPERQIIFGTQGGGGTSGGGSSSGSWSGGSQTKTNTAAWDTSTAIGTCAYNYADACWSYGTVSLVSSDSSWYGYSWAWACMTNRVETDVEITYTIQVGARTKNIADWPYHGMSVKYKDADDIEQTYMNIAATSTGNYWANAYYESDSYNYQVKTPFTFTFSLTYKKNLGSAYTRVVSIRFYNDHSYWCNLGGMYQWENKLNITLTIPARTKYEVGVQYSKGGTATVGGTSKVYVNPNSTVQFVATPDTEGGCTFNGWYLPQDVTFSDAYGYVANSTATPVSNSTTYSKIVTEDFQLIAIFDGYHEPADWGEDAESQVYVKESGEWKLSDVFVKNSTWGKAVPFVG